MQWWSEDRRIRVRRGGEPDPNGRCVVYWMNRAQRALDNPALETAIRAANEIKQPVVVFFALLATHRVANLRHYSFMIEGLADTARRLRRRGIGFVVRIAGATNPAHDFVAFCAEARAAMAVVDENPLRASARWREAAAAAIAVPLLSVDADIIVPSALLQREHYAARTIRPHIHAALSTYLRPVGNLTPQVAWPSSRRLRSLRPSARLLAALTIDRSVARVANFRGGTSAALVALDRFLARRLSGYAAGRNHPELDATSQLSPYLHFGQIGPHTVALAAMTADAPAADREAFLEELIVRRELAVNFVRFNPHYDRIESAEPWAIKTLAAHSRDRHDNRYSAHALERAATHDPLWNAAQRQMVASGWMHGYVRMYWAKKILEWSSSPQAALRVAVWLNDRYELDGRDPNGYAGIAWAIGGKHDRPWGPERPIYGLVRYMSLASTSRKFDSKAYIARWTGGERFQPAR